VCEDVEESSDGIPQPGVGQGELVLGARTLQQPHTVIRADITMTKLQAIVGGQKKAIYQYQRERLRLCLL